MPSPAPIHIQQSQTDVVDTARRAIVDRLQLGSVKYHSDDWRGESVVRHVRRAIKHALTALEISDGDRADDGDGSEGQRTGGGLAGLTDDFGEVSLEKSRLMPDGTHSISTARTRPPRRSGESTTINLRAW